MKNNHKYMRICRRCNSIFEGSGKYSKICEKCKKPSGPGYIVKRKMQEKEQ